MIDPCKINKAPDRFCFKRPVVLVFIMSILIGCSFANGNDWRVEKSTHFIIYYYDNYSFARKVVRKAEDCYRKIARDIGFVRYKDFWLTNNRCKIYIYKTHQDYISITKQPRWSGGCVSYKEKVIRTYQWSEHFLDSLLPHELTHIVFREFVGFENKNIPLWLDEGVACYHEKYKRRESHLLVKKAIYRKNYIPLEKLSGLDIAKETDPVLVGLFYSEATSLVEFLIKRYTLNRFTKLCRLLRDGRKLDEALKSVYHFKDLGGLEDKWLQYIRNRF